MTELIIIFLLTAALAAGFVASGPGRRPTARIACVADKILAVLAEMNYAARRIRELTLQLPTEERARVESSH